MKTRASLLVMCKRMDARDAARTRSCTFSSLNFKHCPNRLQSQHYPVYCPVLSLIVPQRYIAVAPCCWAWLGWECMAKHRLACLQAAVLVAGQASNLSDPALNADPLFAVTGQSLSLHTQSQTFYAAGQLLTAASHRLSKAPRSSTRCA